MPIRPTKKMKILFLDLDGVLVTDASMKLPKVPFPINFHLPFKNGWDKLDDEAVTRLNKITDSTDAKIVISSTWRLAAIDDESFFQLKDYLYSQGIKAEIIDKTPTHNYQGRIRYRYDEIQSWLSSNLVDSFVILDDDDDMSYLTTFHVHTQESIGLQDLDVDKAISILATQ